VNNVPPVRSFPFQALMWVDIALGALVAVGGGLTLGPHGIGGRRGSGRLETVGPGTA
jgi:hypothetical protein